MLKRRILSILLVLTMMLPAAYAAQPAQDGMRGVWVSTVYNIDYPSAQGLSASVMVSPTRVSFTFLMLAVRYPTMPADSS